MCGMMWLAQDGKARAAIGLAVEESQKTSDKTFENSKRIFWDILKKHHEKANITNKVR